MLRNYLLVALRNLNRNRVYSLINIFGLSTGIAVFVLIYLFVQDEMSYDEFHEKAGRTYRLVEVIDAEGQGEESSSNPFPAAPTLVERYPELIEEAVRLFNFQQPSLTLQAGDAVFNEKQLFFADSNFFRVFDFPIREGNSEEVLKRPNSIVLTAEAAQRYFGLEDPIGKTLLLEGRKELAVTGVLESIPSNTHMHFDGLISFSTLRTMLNPAFMSNWVWNPCWTYLLLEEDVDPKWLENRFSGFIADHYPDYIQPQVSHRLQPLRDIHLSSNLEYEIEPNNNRSAVNTLMLIGVFVLLIACINFMNLSTARSANRVREIGMRKVFGAFRVQLMQQFLGESIIMCLIALVLALCLIEISLPVFNELTGKSLNIGMLTQPAFLVGLLGLGALVGVFSGLYPALFLSSFQPAKVLKGGGFAGQGTRLLRRVLVVVQFAMSTALIIGTVVIYEQFQFLTSADPGFNRDQTIIIPAKAPITPRYGEFRAQLLGGPGVVEVTHMNEVLGEDHNVHQYNYEGMEPGKWIYFPSLIVDNNFVRAFDLEVLAGRDFHKNDPAEDTLGVLINEAMVRHLNWNSPEEALGRQMHTGAGPEKVVGVLRDFNYVSLLRPIQPFVLDIAPPGMKQFFMKYFVVRVDDGDPTESIRHIRKVWERMAPDYPFEYSFLSDRIDRQYHAQGVLGQVVGGCSVMAVLIACLGLFALASFTAERRTREIGIRKVLGASESQVVALLVMDFMRLVLLANLLAWPVCWYFLKEWLGSFAYHISIHWQVFAGTLACVVLVALTTVIVQAILASRTDPVRTLRTE